MQHVLAIESSTDRLSLALLSDGHTYAFEGEGGAAASSTMLARIAELLAQAGISVAQLDLVAFGQGPGAFTGLRAACAVAQGLAVAARPGGIPVLPVNTLMACAQAARTQLGSAKPMVIGVCMDARMREIYTAAYGFEESDGGLALPQQLMAPALVQPSEVLALTAQASHWCGNALAVYGAELGERAANVPWCAAMPSANAMLTLVPALLAAGAAVPPALARPLYVRDKVALTTAQRMEAKALQAAAQSA